LRRLHADCNRVDVKGSENGNPSKGSMGKSGEMKLPEVMPQNIY